jgi:hypothetical protein
MRPRGSRQRAVSGLCLALPLVILLKAAAIAAAAIPECLADASRAAGGDLSVSQDCRYTPGVGSVQRVLGIVGGPPALINDADDGKALASGAFHANQGLLVL